jgi:hypothetical protein
MCGAMCSTISGALLSERVECTELAEPRFPHLQNGDNNNLSQAFLTGYQNKTENDSWGVFFLGGCW